MGLSCLSCLVILFLDSLFCLFGSSVCFCPCFCPACRLLVSCCYQSTINNQQSCKNHSVYNHHHHHHYTMYGVNISQQYHTIPRQGACAFSVCHTHGFRCGHYVQLQRYIDVDTDVDVDIDVDTDDGLRYMVIGIHE